jgi:hypothetical protein
VPNPLPSYGKIYNLGHRAIRDLFDHEVRIQEKVDGSQFSFGIRDGQLHMRSKRVELHAGAAVGQFMMAVQTVCRLFDERKLTEGWTYRGEAITKPRHNHLVYERIPVGGVILFDIDKGQEDFMPHDSLVYVANQLGLEVVPEYDVGMVSNIEGLNELLTRKSCLGGEKTIEGIVIKPTGPVFDEHTGKLLRAKLVAVEFKETQTSSWKKANPGANDVVKQITEGLTTEARWRKALQAAADDGELDHSPKDIGPMLGRIQKDIFEEEGERIKEALFKHFWKTVISRGVTRGFPEWYKAQLLELQSFGDNEEEE